LELEGRRVESREDPSVVDGDPLSSDDFDDLLGDSSTDDGGDVVELSGTVSGHFVDIIVEIGKAAEIQTALLDELVSDLLEQLDVVFVGGVGVACISGMFVVEMIDGTKQKIPDDVFGVVVPFCGHEKAGERVHVPLLFLFDAPVLDSLDETRVFEETFDFLVGNGSEALEGADFVVDDVEMLAKSLEVAVGLVLEDGLERKIVGGSSVHIGK